MERPAPRPVAGLPELPARDLAQAWLVTVLASRPLERAAEVPVADVAADGPALCDAVLRALGDDGALAALGAQGPRLAALAAAAGPGEAVLAAEALRGAVLRALRRADPDAADAAADRLSHCCAVLAAAAATPVVDPEERAAALLGAAPLPAAVIAVEGTRTGKPGLGVHAGTGEPGSGVHGCVDAAEGRWLVVADADGAMDLAARIAADVEGTAGVAVRREAGEDPLQLVGLADERMFAARAAGVLVR